MVASEEAFRDSPVEVAAVASLAALVAFQVEPLLEVVAEASWAVALGQAA